MAQAREAQAAGRALSIGLLANAADALPELRSPRCRARPRHGPDERPRPLERLRPEPHVLRGGACGCGRATPGGTWRRPGAAWASTSARCWTSRSAGPSSSTTATTSARRRRRRGSQDAFDFPGFVPAYIRPLFCEGKGPFRWAVLSGDPEGPRRDRRRGAPHLPRRQAAPPLDHDGARAREVRRGCPRGSAGWATASGRGWASSSTSSSARAPSPLPS